MRESKRAIMGARFQELRQAKGLSQSQLAKAAGLPTSTLKNWEQGRREPLFSAAYQLARALGISLDELASKLFEEEQPPAPSAPKPKGRPRKAPTAAQDERSSGKAGEAPSGRKKPGRGKKKGKGESS